ncbi:fatty acid synthase-like [Dermacentor silvarum]|uniref:fatty acid synthase-like n=1 Tax=Dermacentor silvarum TaxID=543639 RepID=UPI00210199F2|nr:fatty acid synthase-like [Dermacentor silvarum]
MEELPVILENITVHRNIVLPETRISREPGTVRLITIVHSSGEFEVMEDGTLAASGCIRAVQGGASPIDTELPVASTEGITYELDAEDIYKDLAVRGHDYQGAFRGIMKADIQGSHGMLQWQKNWVTFFDSMIQYIMFKSPDRELRMATSIESCRFDPCVHDEVIKKTDDTGLRCASHLQSGDRHLPCWRRRHTRPKDQHHYSGTEQQTPLVEEYRFVPYMDDKDSMDKRESITREYVEVCYSVARRALDSCCDSKSSVRDVMSDVRNIPEHVVSQYLEDSHMSHGLLRFLHAVHQQADRIDTSLAAYIQSAFPAHSEDLETDILSTALFEEDPLRFLLDTVVENTDPKKLRVLELAAEGSDCLLASWLATYLSKFNLLPTTEYTIAHSSPERLSGKVPQGATVVSFGSAASRKTLPEVDLIVARSATWSSSETRNLVDEVSSICRENGFVLIAKRTALTPAERLLGEFGGVEFQVAPADEVEAQFLKHGLRLVALKSNNLSGLYLFRKLSVPVEEAMQEIVMVDSEHCNLVDLVKKKALDYEWKAQGENMWLLAEGAGASGVVGLVNCLRYASGGSHIRCVLDASSAGTDKLADFNLTNPECKDLMEKNLVMNVYRNGQWGCYRHVVAKSGDLASSEPILGQEFSGMDQAGRRVMGVVPSQALATMVAPDPALLWDVPDGWTLAEASTVPLSYSTAYYALLVRGNMRPGESVLVHSGSEGIGQAAIAIALFMRCTVFATVGSATERQFLKSHFPQLEDSHIVNYSSICLEEQILGQTQGRGVDLVFNTLQGAHSKAIAHCLTSNGRYLIINAAGTSSHPPHEEVSSKKKVVNVITVPANVLFLNDTTAVEDKQRVAELVRGGIASGAVRPLPATVFTRDKVVDAFTLQASETSNGKVVLGVRPEKSHQIEDNSHPFTVEAIARTYFYNDKAYVIVGELSGFAVEFVDWMVSRGCRKLLLTASHGVLTGYPRLRLHRWKAVGTSVVVSEADVSTTHGALQIIKEAEAMGPVGGIFNVSACHEDSWVANQASEVFQADHKTKADGTRHLDEHSRKLCPQLDHFVVFSSISSGRGALGRTLTGYIDSALERLCERRVADGFPGLAIQWGAIDEDGQAHDAQSSQAAFKATQPQRMRSALEVMERFLNQSHPVVSSLVKAEVTSSSGNKRENNFLVDSVTRILGFQDSSKLNYNSNLGELGLDSIMGAEVLMVIEKCTGLVLSVQGVRMLTLNGLREMSNEQR